MNQLNKEGSLFTVFLANHNAIQILNGSQYALTATFLSMAHELQNMVYPKSWNAIYVGSDNVGMWNIRAQDRAHLSTWVASSIFEVYSLLNHGEMNILFQRMLFSWSPIVAYNQTSIIQ
ncbi:hypothetical protein IFM89_018950 [Coptis chinensis]|uniref:Uncharacterized protein n=1 Tax=Coptis chinensis TaxID=261450 RepID=A0A835IBL3_9MAGN|nr:hypothetical protein IFM89_018950 [Coptis chinensis]